jgi:multidrug efflux system outer membrane protein
MNTRLHRWAAVGVVVLSTACVKGPDYERPETPAPPEFRAESLPGESVANTAWWDLYQDPVLQALIREGLANNRSLREAMARIAESRATLGIVEAGRYPSVNISGSGKYQETFSDDSTKVLDNANLKLVASYELDLWGRVARSNEAALQGLLATEEAYRTVTIGLVADIAGAYLLLRDLDARMTIAEETLRSRRESAEILSTLADEGLIAAVDADRADLATAETEAVIQALIRSRAQVENGISLLVGRLPSEVQRGATMTDQIFPPAVPAGLPSALLQRRPDVLTVEAALHAQTAMIGVAEASRFPALSLTAGAGVKSTTLSEFTAGGPFFNLGANLLGPLFNAGKSKQQVEVERARTEQVLNQYEMVVLNAFREVEDALVAVETFRAEHEIRLRQQETSRRALASAQVRYEGGMTDYMEVLDLQRSLFSTELQASEALQLHHTAIVQLYRALGGGWSVEQSSSAPTGSGL